MNVPRLRFKGYSDVWLDKQVIDFAPLQRGFDLPVSTIVDGEFPVVFSNGILKQHHQYKAIAPGVVTGRSGTIGNVAYIEKNYWPHNTALWVTDFKKNIPKFVYYFYVNFNLARFGTGSGVPTLNRNDVHLQVIHVPRSLEEQTKIANFLTAVDEKISQLTQKYDLLKQYKKGVMQQIFSQKLRFKNDDGREFPEWEINELGNLASKVNLKNRNLEINNVLTNSATQGIISQNDYFDRDIANKNNLNGYYIVEIDDFVYNPRISSNAPVGPIKRNKLVKGVMSPLYTVFRFQNGNLAYFEHFFETNYWHDYMKSISNFGARHDRMNITNESFFALPISLPTIKEQIKIANFLTALDDKITQAQIQLEAVKQYKKGLLQQMFV